MADEFLSVAGRPLSELEGLKEEIEALESLDLDLLRRRWRSLLGRPAPPRLSANLLRRILAYQHQVARVVDIDRATRRALGGDRKAGGGNSVARRASAAGALRPGVVLEREYAGAMHRVLVTAAGCSWNGREFRSLSQAARAITGTKWNGPRFFGLRTGKKALTSGDGSSDADGAAAAAQ
jgi:hypothetical protein